MYKNRSVGITLAVILLAAVPLFTALPPLAPFFHTPLKVYPGNHAFLHGTGLRSAQGWEAYFRQHPAGYLALGLKDHGESLAPGIYRYDFYFALRPGQLVSFLTSANDVVRIEAADASSQEILIDRTFQTADFKKMSKKLIIKSLVFSTWGRAHHQFEPRVYWHGLSGILLQRVELVPLEAVSIPALEQKAEDFEQMMPALFLDRGYIISRDSDGAPAEIGDAAIWTGLYAAAEALRYKATQNPDALRRMEKSLWALHALAHAAPLHGTLVRYIDANGKVLEQPASKDTYTGFFYGAAQTFPYIRDPALKKVLLSDIEEMASHFLDHDLSFASPYGPVVDLNPSFDKAFVSEAVQEIDSNASMRRDLIKTLQTARWYFWIHGQRPPPAFARFIKVLKHPSPIQIQENLLPLLNDIHSALKTLQRNVHRSALRAPREGLNDSPYIKLDLLLLRALKNLNEDTSGKPLSSLEDIKILPSQSLHALHFIKVAAELLPKPNRFQKYYAANLYDGKALLKTAVQWHQMDEEALTAVLGQTESDTRRTASSHLSYLALHDLIILEKDPAIRFQYQKLFEEQFEPMRSDGNAMIDAMQAAVGLSTKHLGLAFWSLQHYPIDRRGKGDHYWQENKKELLADFGGEVNGQAREPLPPDLRPRDAFLWQRSAHSIIGDQEGWLYPPLDYLFAYWLARTTITNTSTTD